MSWPHTHRRRKRGYAGDLTPQLFMWGILICVSKNLIPSHANYMQHVLRCWERQSDGTEYKKTLRRPGFRHGPRWESLQCYCKPTTWWRGAGCPSPRTPSPALGPSGLASPTPTPKLVPMPLKVLAINRWRVGSRTPHCSEATLDKSFTRAHTHTHTLTSPLNAQRYRWLINLI